MKYFIDCEFIENGKTIDLISIAITADDGRELYLQNTECKFNRASIWVKKHVFPSLRSFDTKRLKPCLGPHDAPSGHTIWASRRQIAADIFRFVGENMPEWWGYYSAYDHVVLCQLFGPMIELPDGWPMWTNDLQQWASQLGISSLESRIPPNNEHDALSDARWNQKAWHYLQARAALKDIS